MPAALPQAEITELDPDDYRLMHNRAKELYRLISGLSPQISKPLHEEGARQELLQTYKNIQRPTAVITESQIDFLNQWVNDAEKFMARVLRKYESNKSGPVVVDQVSSVEEVQGYDEDWGWPWAENKPKKKSDEDNNRKYLKWLAIAGAAGAVGYFGYKFIKSEE